jgi:adenylylsulfate kinase-like enzyme
MDKDFRILWLTGMSGSGKSTLANYIKQVCQERGYKSIIIDGDDVRNMDDKKLGFGFDDVLINNLRIARYCLKQKNSGFSVVIVPVISPYEKVRIKVKDLLSPFFHLIYIKADIDSLKDRDTKGLYLAADNGKINDLIGYSNINPYEEPVDPSIIVNTGKNNSLDESKNIILEFINNLMILKD